MTTTLTLTCPRCGTTAPRTQGAYETYCSPACRERDRKRRRRQRRAMQAVRHPLRPDLDAARTAMYANRAENERDRRARERASRSMGRNTTLPKGNNPLMLHAGRVLRSMRLVLERQRRETAGMPPVTAREEVAA